MAQTLKPSSPSFSKTTSNYSNTVNNTPADSSSLTVSNNETISPGYLQLFSGCENTSDNMQKQRQQLQLLPTNFLNHSSDANSEYIPTTREYTLIAENTTLEIAPGLRVDAWTYNGNMPGPTITAVEGDRVIVHFINKTPLPHTVHFHGDHPSEQD